MYPTIHHSCTCFFHILPEYLLINIYLQNNIVVGKYTSTIVTMEHLGLFRCILAYFNHHLPPKKMIPTTDSTILYGKIHYKWVIPLFFMGKLAINGPCSIPKRRHICVELQRTLSCFRKLKIPRLRAAWWGVFIECKTSFAFVEYNIVDM